jgi:molybdenum cofactor cytidylyltransferase
MSQPSLSVLIPAAGSSQRLGQAKQLLNYKTGTLIQNAIENAQSITPDEVIVVTGANADAIRASVQQAQVRWIHNPQWLSGMGGSIALGAASVASRSTGLMILLCDQWRIQAEDLRKLAETWRASPERIVCARADGLNMPPLIFPSSCYEQLRCLKGDHGARSLLTAHHDILTHLPLENAAFDLDTQAHLDTLKTHEL